MHSLWHSEARRCGRLRLPRPLGWQAGSGLHWQRAVPGIALLDKTPQPDAASSAAAGALVAALHGTPAPAAPALGEAELRQRLHEVVAVLGQVLPTARPQLDDLATALLAGLPAALEAAPCTLHGDLHPRNLLAEGEMLSLIDLDSARRGPAVLELGAWLADGLYRAALQGHDLAATTRAGQAFVAAYAAAGGARHDAQALAWATAWQLLCQRAWRCVVNLKPGRFALTPRLLEQASGLLAPQAVHEVAA
jgi:Ser/Thr protein kinase RdoA (MazF antagonist)